MRLRILPFVMATAVAAILTGAGVLARQSDPARRAFEAARKTEVIDRDLPGAITGYRNVVLQYPSNRGVAADVEQYRLRRASEAADRAPKLAS